MPERKPRIRSSKGNSRFADHRRRAVCEEAARIMVDESVRDYHNAKHKACDRLGLDLRRTPLPTNREIESALAMRLRLFRGHSLAGDLQSIRQHAAELMRLFAVFEPRLVGALLRGNVTPMTPIELHLFADSPEDVVEHLASHRIPCRALDKRVRFSRNRFENIPGFQFSLDEWAVELLTFPRQRIGEAPICPVEGKPMKRASLRVVEDLLLSGQPA